MTEDSAQLIAGELNGEAWNSGGGIWLVIKKSSDGRLFVMSDDVVYEYESEEAFSSGQPSKAIGF